MGRAAAFGNGVGSDDDMLESPPQAAVNRRRNVAISVFMGRQLEMRLSELALPKARGFVGGRESMRVCKLALLVPGVLAWLVLATAGGWAQTPAAKAPEKIIIDTDIGDDVDDAFAVALALKSPEVQILGITTTFGDTETRAKLVDRMLGEGGRADIPVAMGKAAETKSNFTQRRYAEGGRFARGAHPDAVNFILEQIRKNPGEITLVAMGPLVNVGGLID